MQGVRLLALWHCGLQAVASLHGQPRDNVKRASTERLPSMFSVEHRGPTGHDSLGLAYVPDGAFKRCQVTRQVTR